MRSRLAARAATPCFSRHVLQCCACERFCARDSPTCARACARGLGGCARVFAGCARGAGAGARDSEGAAARVREAVREISRDSPGVPIFFWRERLLFSLGSSVFCLGAPGGALRARGWGVGGRLLAIGLMTWPWLPPWRACERGGCVGCAEASLFLIHCGTVMVRHSTLVPRGRRSPRVRARRRSPLVLRARRARVVAPWRVASRDRLGR